MSITNLNEEIEFRAKNLQRLKKLRDSYSDINLSFHKNIINSSSASTSPSSDLNIIKNKAISTKSLNGMLKPKELYKISAKNFKPRAIYTESLFKKSITDENLIKTINKTSEDTNIKEKGKLTSENLQTLADGLKFEEEGKNKSVKIEVEEREKNECGEWESYFESFYVDASENYLGNYDNYLSSSLKLLNLLPKINWTDEINKRKVSLDKSVLQVNEGKGSVKNNKLSNDDFDKENINSMNFQNINISKENNLKDSNNNKTNKKTLILDLDETLIHSDMDKVFTEHDEILKLNCDGAEHQIPIMIRPGLTEFLEYVSQHFEVVIFTASCKDYADTILDYIDRDNKYFSMRLYRDSCLYLQPGIYIKDLSIFEDRQLDNLIIVDNSLLSFANNLNNGILVSSFYYDKEDNVLDSVVGYLDSVLKDAIDVRAANEETFGFNTYKNELLSIVQQEIDLIKNEKVNGDEENIQIIESEVI